MYLGKIVDQIFEEVMFINVSGDLVYVIVYVGINNFLVDFV